MTVLFDQAGAGSTCAERVHEWRVVSRHGTSEGTVVYVRCARCGVQRVEVQESAHLPPLAISREVASRR